MKINSGLGPRGNIFKVVTLVDSQTNVKEGNYRYEDIPAGTIYFRLPKSGIEGDQRDINVRIKGINSISEENDIIIAQDPFKKLEITPVEYFLYLGEQENTAFDERIIKNMLLPILEVDREVSENEYEIDENGFYRRLVQKKEENNV